MLASSKYPDKLIHRDLKEQLYYDVIRYFDQGKASQLVTYCNIPATGQPTRPTQPFVLPGSINE